MAVIRCTAKLQEQLGFRAPSLDDSTPFDWHANLLWIERKKHVLFCSDSSRLTCLTRAVTKSEIRDLPGLLKVTLRGVMEDEYFDGPLIDRVVAAHDQMAIGKTSNKSVLGTISDNTSHIRLILSQEGGLDRFGLRAMHHHLNNMPMEPNNWKYAIEAFGQTVVCAVV